MIETSYFVEIPVSGMPGVHLVKPNFEPRKAGQGVQSEFTRKLIGGTASSDTPSAQGEPPVGVKSLTAEQKQALLSRLHHGKNDLTLQEWDDFLADLEDLGLISHDERFRANGILNDALAGDANGCSSRPGHFMDLYSAWDGNPTKFLEDMDLRLMKNQMYARLGNQCTAGLTGQRAAYAKVSQIIQELLRS